MPETTQTNLTLIERAQTIHIGRKSTSGYTEQEIHLAEAWADGKVSISQVGGALSKTTGSVYPFLCYALRESRRQLLAEIKELQGE